MKQSKALKAKDTIDAAYLRYDIPEMMQHAIIEDGDYNILRFLDHDDMQALNEHIHNMMFDCFEREVDLADIEGFRQVSNLNAKGDPLFVEAVEAMAYVLGAAFALGTYVEDGKLVSRAAKQVDLSKLTVAQRRLATELAEQVFGDSFQELSVKDTTTRESLKGAIEAAIHVMQTQKQEDVRKLIFSQELFDQK